MNEALRALEVIGSECCSRCGGLGREFPAVAVGDFMRRRRMDVRLSMRALAAKMGVSAAYVCDLEKGLRRWSPILIQRAFEATKP